MIKFTSIVIKFDFLNFNIKVSVSKHISFSRSFEITHSSVKIAKRVKLSAKRSPVYSNTEVKFAQQGGLISDKIEGLSYSAKSIENDEYYHISKNKKKL